MRRPTPREPPSPAKSWRLRWSGRPRWPISAWTDSTRRGRGLRGCRRHWRGRRGGRRWGVPRRCWGRSGRRCGGGWLTWPRSGRRSGAVRRRGHKWKRRWGQRPTDCASGWGGRSAGTGWRARGIGRERRRPRVAPAAAGRRRQRRWRWGRGGVGAAWVGWVAQSRGCVR